MIDWQSLGAELASQLALPQAEVIAIPIPGGDINEAFRLESGDEKYFVKLNRAELLGMFEAEKAGLDAIRLSHTIRVPEVMRTGQDSGYAFIVMEWIELGGHSDVGRFATELAAMHGSLEGQFGFECDNTIGSTPQSNNRTDDWIEFWRCQRLGFQLELAEQNGLAAALIDAGHRLLQDLDKFFDVYQPRPSLLHGDLWSGNHGTDLQGEPVIYDPACYYGDHEVDLAMLELFGNPGAQFFAVYAESFPIDSGYTRRRELYNLYHILNHALLFGGAYQARALRMTNSLLKEY